MSKLKLFNILVAQWFFVRLARVCDEGGAQTGWTWIVGVIPLTGWSTAYRYLPGFGGA